jgi:hypothetical protein
VEARAGTAPATLGLQSSAVLSDPRAYRWRSAEVSIPSLPDRAAFEAVPDPVGFTLHLWRREEVSIPSGVSRPTRFQRAPGPARFSLQSLRSIDVPQHEKGQRDRDQRRNEQYRHRAAPSLAAGLGIEPSYLVGQNHAATPSSPSGNDVVPTPRYDRGSPAFRTGAFTRLAWWAVGPYFNPPISVQSRC